MAWRNDRPRTTWEKLQRQEQEKNTKSSERMATGWNFSGGCRHLWGKSGKSHLIQIQCWMLYESNKSLLLSIPYARNCSKTRSDTCFSLVTGQHCQALSSSYPGLRTRYAIILVLPMLHGSCACDLTDMISSAKGSFPLCAHPSCSGGAQNRVPTALIAEGNRTWLARLDVTKSDLIQEFQSEVSGKMLQDVARRCKFRSVDGPSVTKCHQVWKSGRPW